MHGDLAARNVLICSDVGNLGSGLVAKVADFGLAKNFYDNLTYKKAKRKYLPWKWMVSTLVSDLNTVNTFFCIFVFFSSNLGVKITVFASLMNFYDF